MLLSQRTRKSAITLSQSAETRLKELMEEKREEAKASGDRKIVPHGLRLSLKKEGCGGFSFDLDYLYEDRSGTMDERVSFGDREDVLYIDNSALMNVVGTEMDFVRDKIREEFVFMNPKARAVCGCGISFTPL